MEEAVHRLGRERFFRRLFGGEGDAERHALLARAHLSGAIDVEELRLLRRLAGAQDGVFELGARHLLLDDDGKVALHALEFGQVMIDDVLCELPRKGVVVELGKIHGLFKGEFFGERRVQFAHPAHFALAHADESRLPGVQEGLFAAPEGKAERKTLGDRFHGAFQIEEIIISPDGERHALIFFGERLQGELLGEIGVGKLKQPPFRVAAAHVAHDVLQHRGRKESAHDGKIFADGVENADGAAFGRVFGQAEEVEIFGRIEGIVARLEEALARKHPLEFEFLLLGARPAAVGDGRAREKSGLDVLVPVHADDLFGKVGPAVHVLAP